MEFPVMKELYKKESQVSGGFVRELYQRIINKKIYKVSLQKKVEVICNISFFKLILIPEQEAVHNLKLWIDILHEYRHKNSWNVSK